jgi:hypothetical protein
MWCGSHWQLGRIVVSDHFRKLGFSPRHLAKTSGDVVTSRRLRHAHPTVVRCKMQGCMLHAIVCQFSHPLRHLGH